ncbi:MAG: hypothetical protein A4E62_01932 [Syntrophorhabdus sp. PtaU1.Bin002]|nr:MAG: hypothetical protein A4E62_01932 [Syntrophorhabdus sp. PtaU1.Bin002]
MPECVFLECFNTEVTSVYYTEYGTGKAPEKKEYAKVPRRAGPSGKKGCQAACGEDDPVPCIAEHHAEHHYITEGDKECRFQLLIVRKAVGRNQHFEGTEQPRVPKEYGDLFLRCIRRGGLKNVSASCDFFHALLQDCHITGRDPSRNQNRSLGARELPACVQEPVLHIDKLFNLAEGKSAFSPNSLEFAIHFLQFGRHLFLFAFYLFG